MALTPQNGILEQILSITDPPKIRVYGFPSVDRNGTIGVSHYEKSEILAI